jgi:tRNA A-37 threonylcarbamoyl transferase component Bud32
VSDSEEIANFVGHTLGNWRIQRLLGAGAFGAVYEGENVAIVGRRAAIKVLHPHLAMHVTYKERFLNEASAASRAEHENIIQVFDGGINEEGICYSVMELLKGSTLTDTIGKGALSPARTVNVGRQIASALDAAHAMQIVHRDLKPDNIFIQTRSTNPEFVKVLDFGVAKLRDVHQTQDGTLIGTPGYMSPEQWRTQNDIDGRSDIYALGIILFECLAGRLPYSGNTTYEWMQAHLTGPLPDASQLPGVPPKLVALVRGMMAKEREVRPATMAEVCTELSQLAQSMSTITEAPASIKARPSSRAWLPWVGGGLALLMIVGGVVGLRAGTRNPEDAKNERAYHAFLKAAKAGDEDGALASFGEIAPDSPYRQKAADRVAEVRRVFLKEHLAAARKAAADGDCATTRQHQQAIATTIGENDEAAAIKCAAGGEAGPSAAEAEQRLAEAQRAAMRLRYAEAIALARQAVTANPKRAWRIIGESSCALKDHTTAASAFENLDDTGRRFLTTACASYGIELP